MVREAGTSKAGPAWECHSWERLGRCCFRAGLPGTLPEALSPTALTPATTGASSTHRGSNPYNCHHQLAHKSANPLARAFT